MTENSLDSDLSNAEIDTIKEVVREAELFLEGQLTTALAADRRAMNLAGFLIAIAAAISGGIINSLTSAQPVWLLLVTGVLVVIGLVSAAFFALEAARPITWQLAGNTPSEWRQDAIDSTSLKESLAEQAAHYDEMIKANQNAINHSAEKFDNSFLTVQRAIIVGVSGLVLQIIVTLSVG